jgi:hypothetical protein
VEYFSVMMLKYLYVNNELCLSKTVSNGIQYELGHCLHHNFMTEIKKKHASYRIERIQFHLDQQLVPFVFMFSYIHSEHSPTTIPYQNLCILKIVLLQYYFTSINWPLSKPLDIVFSRFWNKFKLNFDKAIVRVSTANKISAYRNTGYDNKTTEEVEKIKYLGLQTDINFSWEKTTEYIISKLSSASFVTRTLT